MLSRLSACASLLPFIMPLSGMVIGLVVSTLILTNVLAAVVDPKLLDSCPGYKAIGVQTRPNGLSAELVLGEKPCNIFGDDINRLLLNVVYETSMPFQSKIFDYKLRSWKTTEFMSKLLLHPFLDMKFQSLFFLDRRAMDIPRRRLQSLASITRFRRSLSPSIANLPGRFYFQLLLIPSSSSLNICASKRISLLMPIFMD